jgi:DNA-binding transcriptional ArsR family regulator
VAALVGLTDAAVSKHFKLLQDAGWVTPQRRGHYVYYRLERDRVADLSGALAEILA